VLLLVISVRQNSRPRFVRRVQEALEDGSPVDAEGTPQVPERAVGPDPAPVATRPEAEALRPAMPPNRFSDMPASRSANPTMLTLSASE
jgi:hypothetical protein